MNSKRKQCKDEKVLECDGSQCPDCSQQDLLINVNDDVKLKDVGPGQSS